MAKYKYTVDLFGPQFQLELCIAFLVECEGQIQTLINEVSESNNRHIFIIAPKTLNWMALFEIITCRLPTARVTLLCGEGTPGGLVLSFRLKALHIMQNVSCRK